MEIKTYKREDGTRISVNIRLSECYNKDTIYISVSYAPKGKRKFLNCYNCDDWKYRSLSMEERETYRRCAVMKYITEDELNECISLFFEKIKNCCKLYFD